MYAIRSYYEVADRKAALALAERRNLGEPRAVAAVEQPHRIARTGAHHVAQVMRLGGGERHLRPRGEGVGNVEARRGGRHGEFRFCGRRSSILYAPWTSYNFV